MQLKANIFTLTLFLWTAIPLSSLSSNPDTNQLEQAESEAEKIAILHNLCDKYRFRDPDKALEYCDRCKTLAKETGDLMGQAQGLEGEGMITLFRNDAKSADSLFERAIALYKKAGSRKSIGELYLDKGIILSNKIRFQEAIKSYKKALEEFSGVDSLRMMGRAHRLIARTNKFRSYYSLSLDHLYKALELFDSTDHDQGMADCYLDIGQVHSTQGDHEKAFQLHQKALRIYKKVGDTLGMAFSHNNLGSFYKRKEKWEKAKEHFERSMELHQKGRNRKGKAYAKMELASVLIQTKEFQKARALLDETHRTFREYQDFTGIVSALNLIGDLFLKEGIPDSAMYYYRSSIPHSKRIDNKEGLMASFKGLAEANYMDNKGNKAYQFHKKFVAYKDSVLNQDHKDRMAELEAKFQFKEQKKELKLQETKLEQRKFQRNALIGGVLLALIFSGFLFYQIRQKNRVNQLLEEQKKLIEQKNQDITDSIRYANRIQQAILPPSNSLEQFFHSGFILHKPRDIISGDFYWMEELNGKLLFAAVDCTGHGVPGALISIVGHQGLDKAVKEFGMNSPSEILGYLDGFIKKTLNNKASERTIRDGMDIALCSYDPNTLNLTFAGANNPLYLVKGGEEGIARGILEYKGDRMAIGAGLEKVDGNEKSFHEHSIQLEQGDRIYVFSDGFADQFGGPSGKKMKYKRFQEILLNWKKKTINGQEKALDEKFREWKGNLEQLDDVLVIGAEL